jgi:hypothetical protein
MQAEAQRQITLLLQQQEELAPELYRDLALYLQVLREGLLHAVQQACFHLATQVVPERYNQLPNERRQAFQQRLQQLVQRCTVLLTVEQVMSLAAQQQRRQQRQQHLRQQRLLEAFLEGQDPGETASGESPSEESKSAQTTPQPEHGSVHLSLDLPLSADLFDRGLPGMPSPRPSDPAEPEDDSNAASSEQQLLQSIFELASQGLQQPSAHTSASSAEALAQDPADRDDDAGHDLGLEAADPATTGSVLPRDPLLQLRWWGHFDRALRRRLRNLSHAVNVEMLRLGLAQGLLPMNLLDAVLDGQVDALPAPSNVLRLPLPAGQLLGPQAPTEVLALLLRMSDIEYEQPRLRTCRKRLEQRRSALRTMAKRYRTWQRRLSAFEAEQQWFQDSAPSQSPSTDQP